MSSSRRSSTFRFGLLELETFLAVVDYGSFNSAAKKLHVSQPAVTHRVQRLESTLNTRLLNRTTRRMELTPAGRKLYENATQALNELRLLIDEFQSETEGARRRVVVAASPVIAARTMPSIIRRFSEQHPQVDVHIRDMQHDDIVKALHNAEVDLGVVAFEGDPRHFRFEPLGEDPIVLVMPGGHPLSVHDDVSLDLLSAHPVLSLRQYSRIASRLTTAMSERELPLNMAPPVTNLTTLLAMLDEGHGVALLPKSMAQMHAQQPRKTVALNGLKLTRRFGILVSRRHDLTHAAEHFCEQLRRDFALK